MAVKLWSNKIEQFCDSTGVPRAGAKFCGSCSTEKPAAAEHFHANKGKPDGLSTSCKECAKKRAAQWYWDNKDRSVAKAKDYYAANRDKIKARSAEWYRNNHDDALAYMEKRRREKPEIVRAAVRRWWKENPEHAAAVRRGYKARKRNALGRHTGDDIKQLYVEQGGCCAACKAELSKYHVDHVLPLILGGSNDRTNLQLLCPTCNMSKGGKHPSAWRGYGRQAAI